jgi:hypothetical protein
MDGVEEGGGGGVVRTCVRDRTEVLVLAAVVVLVAEVAFWCSFESVLEHCEIASKLYDLHHSCVVWMYK